MFSGLLSSQGEKSIDFYFIRVPLRKKVLKYGTPKPSVGLRMSTVLGLSRLQVLMTNRSRIWGCGTFWGFSSLGFSALL